jgi:ATP-dependent Clp protease ATP-binding subunit ClpC
MAERGSASSDMHGAMTQALAEAVALRHDYIGTEHVMLGMMRNEECGAARIIRELGAAPAAVIERIEQSVRPGYVHSGQRPIQQTELPLTSRTKHALQHATQRAIARNSSLLDTPDLLIGLLMEGKNIAAVVLNSVGVTLDNAAPIADRIAGPETRPPE